MRYVFLLICLSLQSAFAQDKIDALVKRIEELERQQEEMLIRASDNRPQVSSFLKDNLTLGGFFEPAYTVWNGPDTPFQATGTSFFLGLNLAASYSEKMKFVSQLLTGITINASNPHNNPDGTTRNLSGKREFDTPFFGSILTQGYLEYSFTSAYRLQGGIGYVPFGYAHQQRELVLFIRRNGPQLLRTTSLVGPLWTGFNFLGDFASKDTRWGYSIYTFPPPEAPVKPGAGGRVYWSSAEERLTLGLSTQVTKIADEGATIWGTDFHYKSMPYNFVGEFAHNVTKSDDVWSAYFEPGIYAFDEEYLFYVFGDYAFSSRNRLGPGKTAPFDPYQKWEYGGGLNWLPTSFTRLRAGLTFHDYVGMTSKVKGQDRDYVTLDLSAGVAF